MNYFLLLLLLLFFFVNTRLMDMTIRWLWMAVMDGTNIWMDTDGWIEWLWMGICGC